MKNIVNNKNKSGFTLIEVLIACMIISTTIFALMSATSKGINLSTKALRQVQASTLIEEGAEAVKSIRDTNWGTISGLTLNTNYYLSFNANTWTLSTTPPDPIDEIFTRTIIFSQVYRNSNDDISSSGTIDSNIKKVDVAASWISPSGTNSKDLIFYVANIFN